LRIKQNILRRIIKEELEVSLNVQTAIVQAKEAGASEDDVQTVLAMTHDDEEIIVLLRDLGADYPIASHEDD